MTRRCATPGCGTLTLGEICLACEQKRAAEKPDFPRGRPYVPAAGPTASTYATANAKASPRSHQHRLSGRAAAAPYTVRMATKGREA